MYLDMRLGKRNLGLGISMIFLVSLTLSLMRRTARYQAMPQALAKCWKLKGLFGTGNLSEQSVLLPMTARDEELVRAIATSPVPEKDKKILEHLLLAQECPWEPNATAVTWYRTGLGTCCNASHWLAITKENTPLGSDILLDGNKGKKMRVEASLIELLPERSPISGVLYDHCAVVGNGGNLRNSSCGQEIDQADLIVRFNMPPMNYSEDIGTKTSLFTINPSIINNRFNKLQARRRPFVDALRPYRHALAFIPGFSFQGQSDLAYQALYAMEDFGTGQQAYFLNPHYMSALGRYWKGQGLEPNRLSSGFMLVSVALEFCKRITLYGFWPFANDLAGRPIPHHYYDNNLPKPGMHAMNREFSYYLKMYAQGVLRLRLGKCQ
ncbi:alpha-N-acetylneuraminide alpha-2,8-sialyltransferase-like [Paroedura picta]|uniref:alpha-N-acetylneuraminide alpha-2,8-sialyltransferase-like n=1 Tax=Paroedura picta TaxID=143630 RepID=UPI0040567EE2